MSSFRDRLEEIVLFWPRVVSGRDYIVQDPASYEPVTLTGEAPSYPQGEVYDVGAIVRAYQHEWLGSAPNSVTPANLFDLVEFLLDMTTVIEERDKRVRTIVVPPATEVELSCEELAGAKPGYGQACRDLQRWGLRLSDYMLHLGEVAPEDQEDRRKTLWTVTAPLFLGWYGGPSGHEVELIDGGFPAGFDPEIQHVADIATPYILANQYGVADAWEQKRRELLTEDLTPPPLPELPKLPSIKDILLVGGAVAGAIVGLSLIARK